MKKQRLLLGAHISVAGGFDQAVIRGASIGCTTIQIFTKSNRQWHARPIENDEIIAFKNNLSQSSIDPVIVHASYLINIGASDDTVRTKSLKALQEELQRCVVLGIPYLVLHPGSYGEGSIEECIQRISQGLDAVFEYDTSDTMILLETMAGQGTSACSTLEQLAAVRQASKHKKRIGICLDTCHVFAAGYDVRTPKAYEAFWHAFDAIIGLEHLKVIHINDSKKDLGSHVDRHEDIGQGKLGLAAFELLFNDPRFFSIAKILETPKESLEDDLRNINTIKNLLSVATKKALHVQG